MSVTIEPGAILTQNASILYQNIFEDGTVTVSSETDDGPGLNAVEDTTFDFWTALRRLLISRLIMARRWNATALALLPITSVAAGPL